MKKIVRKKFDAFAKRAKMKPEIAAKLAAALGPASVAQADVIIARAAQILTTRLEVRTASPILDQNGRTQKPAT